MIEIVPPMVSITVRKGISPRSEWVNFFSILVVQSSAEARGLVPLTVVTNRQAGLKK